MSWGLLSINTNSVSVFLFVHFSLMGYAGVVQEDKRGVFGAMISEKSMCELN